MSALLADACGISAQGPGGKTLVPRMLDFSNGLQTPELSRVMYEMG